MNFRLSTVQLVLIGALFVTFVMSLFGIQSIVPTEVAWFKFPLTLVTAIVHFGAVAVVANLLNMKS